MSSTSATGGPLVPDAVTPPAQDDGFDDFLQGIVVGVTGLPGEFVRPRWQESPPKQPNRSVDWCAIGITQIRPGQGPDIAHRPDGDGFDSYRRNEIVEVLATFYGPNCMRYAAVLRDGISIAQNREALYLAGCGLHDVGTIVLVPELVGQQWIRRADTTISIAREVARTYPVLNLLSAGGTIHSETFDEPFNAGA